MLSLYLIETGKTDYKMNPSKTTTPQSAMEARLKQWLSNQPSIHIAILLGSFAKQSSNETSDVDLAIELNQALSTEKKLKLLQSLSTLTDRKIDLVDLKTVGEPLLNQIIQHGKLLKGDKQKLIDLSIKNVNMMQDFTPYIKRTLKEKRERWLQHG